MKCTLTYKAKTFVVSIPEDGFGDLLFDEAAMQTKIAPKRIIIAYNKNGEDIQIKKDTKIKDIGVTSFIVKDAGVSVNWKTVFFLMYFGPLLIEMLLVLLLGDKVKWNCYFTIGFIMWELHYIKRTSESLFFHNYSRSLMQVGEVFVNCLYYWGFTIAVNYNMIKKAQTVENVELCQYIAIPFWFVCECLNFYSHNTLAHLRPKGSKEHVLPKGFLFNHITAPNYTFEILGWFCFAVYSDLTSAIIFASCGGIIMFFKAHQKRKCYIKRWPEAKYRGRLTPIRFL